MSVDSGAREVIEALGQDALGAYFEGLSGAEKAALGADLASLEAPLLAPLRERILRGELAEDHGGACEVLPARKLGEDPAADARARADGERLLREGKVAAFVVAGGQGTRLGHPGPKGTFPAGPVSACPLFALFAQKLLGLGGRYGCTPRFFVMTSPGNHEETTSFFAEHGHFGLDPERVHFFAQGTMPAFSPDGQLILEGPARLFRSPDGHGGSFAALRRSGALDRMVADGVETLFYFQVDNPLVPLCDPVFLGHHLRDHSEFSSISVPKREPGEKVGILARRGGKPCVIEYSDLPDELRHAREPGGELRFRAGNVAIHAFQVDFLRRVATEGGGLPFHFARKKIAAWSPEGSQEIEGIKLETFVFDALPLAARVSVLEAPRAEVFSPIKNREGSDSPATARRDQIALFASWLDQVGVEVPRDSEGGSVHPIEIAATVATSAEELRAHRGRLPDRIDGPFRLDEA